MSLYSVEVCQSTGGDPLELHTHVGHNGSECKPYLGKRRPYSCVWGVNQGGSKNIYLFGRHSTIEGVNQDGSTCKPFLVE